MNITKRNVRTYLSDLYQKAEVEGRNVVHRVAATNVAESFSPSSNGYHTLRHVRRAERVLNHLVEWRMAQYVRDAGNGYYSHEPMWKPN